MEIVENYNRYQIALSDYCDTLLILHMKIGNPIYYESKNTFFCPVIQFDASLPCSGTGY